MKMLYYRGDHECKAGAWRDDAEAVSRAMLSLSCKAGNTQIARVLKLALAEKEKLSGVVFIGDHCEDDAPELLHLAATLGKRSVPLFIFHEIVDYDGRALDARPVFERMAKLSGGVYSEFRPDSGAVIRELLSTVAAFSVAGPWALNRSRNRSRRRRGNYRGVCCCSALPGASKRKTAFKAGFEVFGQERKKISRLNGRWRVFRGWPVLGQPPCPAFRLKSNPVGRCGDF